MSLRDYIAEHYPDLEGCSRGYLLGALSIDPSEPQRPAEHSTLADAVASLQALVDAEREGRRSA